MVSLIRSNKKISIERKWTYREYHVHNNADVAHKDVKIYCNTKQFPELSFCVTHSKPHGTRRLIQHYHLSLDPKLGNNVCEIRHISCACVAFTLMIDKHWIYSISLKNKNTTDLSPIAPIDQSWGHSTVVTSSNCHRNQPLMTHLMKYTRLFLMK